MERSSGGSPGKAVRERAGGSLSLGALLDLRKIKSTSLNDAVSFRNAKHFGIKAEFRAPLNKWTVRWGYIWLQHGRATLAAAARAASVSSGVRW